MAKLVAATYGDALFDLALEQKQVDSFYNEAITVLDVFQNNTELVDFLNHPNIEKQEKILVIENIFKDMISLELTGFLVTITKKSRWKDIKAIFQYFIRRVKEYKGIGVAYITTPLELSQTTKDKLIDKLLSTTKYHEFEMHYQLDKSLIGGIIIQVGDKVIDNSIKSKIKELSKNLYKIDLV